MGDAGDRWREYRKAVKEQRRIRFTALLREYDIAFRSYNHGQHLAMQMTTMQWIDFWPSTGHWRIRTNPRRRFRYDNGCGVMAVIAMMKGAPDAKVRRVTRL